MKQYIFDYLSEVLLNFFDEANISAGERYHIRYEKREQVVEQYNAIPDVAKAKSYAIEPFSFNDYSSYLINFGKLKLIIAASSPGVEVDFLTGLRNRVADNNRDGFEGTAILFIHNTSLDSLIGGCKSLSDTGMPLNIDFIRASIHKKINSDDVFKPHEKHLLNFKLAKIGVGNSDDYSLFNYSIFLQVLGKQRIESEDYVKLGLFQDSKLVSLNKEEAEKRLRKNEEWFEDINTGHQYGGLEKKLEKEFSQKGVDRLLEDDWTKYDLTELIHWENEKAETKNISYLENTSGRSDDLLVLWDKASGATVAKSRIRNLVVFNYEHRDKINITLTFDNKPRKEGFGTKINLGEHEYQISGKKIILTCTLAEPDQITYKSLVYEHPGFSAKYQFHILVLPFPEDLIKEIKPLFTIRQAKHKAWYLEIAIDGALVLNDGKPARLIDAIEEDSEFEIRENQTLELKAPELNTQFEQEEVLFRLNYLDNLIPIHIPVETEKPQYISGPEVRYQKIENKKSFRYHSWLDENTGRYVITLIQDTAKYYCVDEFRENLILERQIIAEGNLAYYQDANKKIYHNPEVAVDDELTDAYRQIISYYKSNDLLPSLAYITEPLEELLTKYVKVFNTLLGTLINGQPLSVRQMNLLRIGTIQMVDGNKLLKFTPLHPLNVAYQLQLKNVLYGKLVSHLLDKLRPLNLVPYIKGPQKSVRSGQNFYQPLEQAHSPEWLYYFFDETSSQQVSRFFVDKLVDQKIEQFLKHFRYLFINGQSTLRINLFNQGDTREILQGIFLYYARYYRKDNPDEAVPIQVRIYGSKDYMTKFEEIALCDDVRLIERAFDFKLPKVNEPENLLDLYNRKVTFFKIDDAFSIDYAHLSFFQFGYEEVSRSSNNMLEVSSGISLDGLLADVPSISQAGAFRTGFGYSGLQAKENELLRLTKGLNAVANVINTDHQFQQEMTAAFVINSSVSNAVRAIYAKSQWVTFIEPKVNLSFFEGYDDVVIIHYSDQYNNASGYDAITITSKWEPYKTTILELFKEQDIHVSEQDVIHIIDMFNTLNGEWLLGMNTPQKTNSPYFRMEKVSLLSAVKAAMAVLHDEQITWVPVSLEEILRISGAVGLKKADGLFSVKNLGEEGIHSDDLLLIGLEDKSGELHMYVYPWEVKIGHVESGTIAKAIDQSFRSASLLRKFLMEKELLSSKIYRNFFAKLFLIGAEKCAIYHVWPEYESKWINAASYRARLLSDDFKISTDLDNRVGYYGVIAFKWSADYLSRSIVYENDGCVMTLLKHDGLDYLTRSLNDLSEEMGEGGIEGLSPFKLLRNRLHSQDSFDGSQEPEDENDNPIEEVVQSTDRGGAPASPEISSSGFDSTTNNEEIVISAQLLNRVQISKEESTRPLPTEIRGEQQADLAFNLIGKSEIATISTAIYEKLTAINIGIKKEMPQDISFIEGPAFYRIEIKPEPTTTIKKIKGAAEELNIALHLPEESSVRIFSDRGKIWLEAPKQDNQKVMVTTSNIWPLFERNEEFRVPFGADIEGKVQSVNYSSTNSPHLLLAGTTGSGKSVVLDTLIRSATKFYTPNELKVFLIDPKGNELIDFEGLPHFPKNNGLTSEDAIELLTEAVGEMDRRYVLFREIRLRAGRAAKDIIEYNRMVEQQEERLPRWLIVLDEYADLLDENPGNKSIIETLLKRLSQKARAAGIHVTIATQKPLATIVSSVIKSNLTGVIALKVRTANDSRVILDDNGAETLAGKGDSLFKNGTGQMVRVQAAIYTPQ
ncbi:FtsK/SpoIIIE domain-containing protein [Pedobacter deserti]|uniref:FtsK/SpoIIIE domain-containing protein n=1 Tax=Pedobacter deserti TaxID=2817382 RepID=UPI002109DB5F|nr:FtsK/SpoIIIE domain-containing protein [Pedobacter sp. SYSU D00382]